MGLAVRRLEFGADALDSPGTVTEQSDSDVAQDAQCRLEKERRINVLDPPVPDESYELEL